MVGHRAIVWQHGLPGFEVHVIDTSDADMVQVQDASGKRWLFSVTTGRGVWPYDWMQLRLLDDD